MTTQLEQHFCEEVLAAITLYEANFRPAHKSLSELTEQERHMPVMSAQRSADVSALRQIVSLPPQNTLATYLGYLNGRLKKMKTGWLFIRSGKSRLKQQVLEVIARYQKPETLFYLRRITELEQQNQWLEEECRRLRNNAVLVSQQQRQLAETMNATLLNNHSLPQKTHLSVSPSPSHMATSLPKSSTRWFGLFGKKSRKETTYSMHTVEQDDTTSLLASHDDGGSIYSASIQ